MAWQYKESKGTPPYADPSWYQDFASPYYNDSHRALRDSLRVWVNKELMPHTGKWEDERRLPATLPRKLGEAGILAAVFGLGRWPTEYIRGDEIPCPGGLKPEDFDYFHELIVMDEFCRCGSGGVVWGTLEGPALGLPPIHNFGSEFIKRKYIPPVLRGENTMCLAITEPYGGSDVAGLRTEAKKSECGKFYIVNGEKKWITNSQGADLFVTAVRTGGSGGNGVSLLIIERTMPGLKVRPMVCSGVASSGTGYVTFEDVQVPVENLIGQENQGFKYIMNNFNHERWQICIQALRFARVCYEDAFNYAAKRKTFGKSLNEYQLIRSKLGNMAKQIEAGWALLEVLTYQMQKMSHAEANTKLGGPTALLKVYTTPVFEFCAREAAQIFGGLGYTKGGQGERVERLNRDVRALAIGGGSEEILLDLGVRQALRRQAANL
eukprot:TRINITY_DN2388_c0_g1_i1.p1 TRINITY_DN2388_c0_g1~~TRINITY_DN2388_c0_g1_i1.p1  ORF type:complete len:444 (-),score=59.21 TRINITY_DN2388_c0_g1_i1:142-1449(-)